MSLSPLPRTYIDQIVRMALEEDVPYGDLTTEAFVPESTHAQAVLTARERGIFCGGEVFAAALGWADPRVVVELLCQEGDSFEPGDQLARVSGPAQPILTGERVGLNLVQRMSGIATVTSAYVAAVEGTAARITDTRKTTPGLRRLERYAVRCGGGHNHRFSLSDAVMVKDNHLAALAAEGVGLTEAIRSARERLPHTTHIEVEVDRLDQVRGAIDGGADTIMLDNFSIADLRAGVALIAGSAVVEASGGITLTSMGPIAATGVDVISVGALTHSAPALDLGLDFTVGP